MITIKPVIEGYVRLNQLTSYDKDFEEILYPCSSSGCEKTVWTSTDPRLISSAHNGQRLVLDRPPLNGKLTMPEVARHCGYPNVYNTYSDIHGGQIRYYYDKQLAVPFIPQLFNTSGLVVKENYIDPMDSHKPHYSRVDASSNNPCDGDGSCLSWIRDSQFHREDMMAKQLWRRNQQDFATNLETS